VSAAVTVESYRSQGLPLAIWRIDMRALLEVARDDRDRGRNPRIALSI
jgi:hypothetical protein